MWKYFKNDGLFIRKWHLHPAPFAASDKWLAFYQNITSSWKQDALDQYLFPGSIIIFD